MLYISNNLINLATAASLYASNLQDLQAVDRMIGLRMLDVRRVYLLALAVGIPNTLVMVINLIDWRIALIGCTITVGFMAHMVHTDYVTTESLASSHVNVAALQQEHLIAARLTELAHRLWGALFGRHSYAQLNERLAAAQVHHEKAEEAKRAQRQLEVEDEEASAAMVQRVWRCRQDTRQESVASSAAGGLLNTLSHPLTTLARVTGPLSSPRTATPTKYGQTGLRGLLSKTPSSAGPVVVLRSVAVDRAAFVGQVRPPETCASSRANAPLHAPMRLFARRACPHRTSSVRVGRAARARSFAGVAARARSLARRSSSGTLTCPA